MCHFQWNLPLTLPSPRAGANKAGTTRGERIKVRGHANVMQHYGKRAQGRTSVVLGLRHPPHEQNGAGR